MTFNKPTLFEQELINLLGMALQTNTFSNAIAIAGTPSYAVVINELAIRRGLKCEPEPHVAEWIEERKRHG